MLAIKIRDIITLEVKIMKNVGLRALTNFFAYIALVLIAAALIMSKLNFAPDVCAIFNRIAVVVAYVLVGFSSFCYAISRRGIIRKLIWLAAAATVVVLLII